MGVQFKQRSACNVKPLGIYLPRNLCGIVSRRYFAVLIKASPIHATRYIIKVFAWLPLTAYRHSSLSIDDPLGAVCKHRFDRAAVFSFGKWRWAIDGAIFVPFHRPLLPAVRDGQPPGRTTDLEPQLVRIGSLSEVGPTICRSAHCSPPRRSSVFRRGRGLSQL